MDRLACVDVPAFPLQLLLRRHPDWRGQPVAVVEHDKPQGQILWVNERARQFHILPGMRYSAALSLSGALRAAEVPSNEINCALESIVRQLQSFTPQVEPAMEDPGVFWLNASGLGRLYDSLQAWARRIHSTLEQGERLQCTVVVGFSHYGTWAIANSSRGVTVFDEPAEEEKKARRVPLKRLDLEPRVRDTFSKLGLKTAGDFADLPAEGIMKRFGARVWRLHQLARGALRVPLTPRQLEEPLEQHVHFHEGEADLTRLMFRIGCLLQLLLKVLVSRDQAAAEVRVEIEFENGGRCQERLRPASPTLNLVLLTDLIHLRLVSVEFPGPVSDLALSAQGVRARREQLVLFAEKPPRDPDAANRALARLRAEFGNRAVVCARLRDRHLPEALFFWEALDHVESARPRRLQSGFLVRRIHSRPLLLPARPRHEPDGWMLRGLQQGPVVRVLGPYIVSGGWWRQTTHREYHFAETRDGEILWVYYDRFRRRWFVQGRVE